MMGLTDILKHCFLFIILGFIAFTTLALPKINIEHDTKANGIPRIKTTNQTALTLACYTGIDGYKKKYVLKPFMSSQWHTATSKQYNHTNFSTWCDNIEFYPDYKKYIK